MRLSSIVAVALSALLLSACAASVSPAAPPLPADAPDALAKHRALFEKRVVTVTDGVHVAIGYALANSICVAVDGGKVIVDTTESRAAAAEILAEFDRLAPGPVLAVIYTHTHADHILGASVFAGPDTPIWATDEAVGAMDEQFASLGATIRRRAARQFGEGLSDEMRTSAGIGPLLRIDDGPVPPLLYPTNTFSGEKTLVIGDTTFVLIASPGETRDQLAVWLPERRTLLPGDDVYEAFPNLYSTRGVPPRPVRAWVRSLDRMRALAPEYLVPSHTGPVAGAAKIDEILTAYRDAIAYIHDSVIREANAGKSPDDMAADIRLPARLAAHPYLQEYYGKVSWSVRGIYDGYLGWFDGNPTNLDRLHPADRAARLVPLMGGSDRVLDEAERALAAGEEQWAAELTDLVLAVEPESDAAKAIRADALWALGEREVNLNARCYLLTSALALRGQWDEPAGPLIDAETLRDVPAEVLIRTLPERLDPVKTADVEMAIGFTFPDTGAAYTLIVRRGVGEFRTGLPEDADLLFTATEADFKAMLIGDLPAPRALTSGRVKATGGLANLLRFRSYLIGP